MKIFRAITAAAFFAATCAGIVSAQTRPAAGVTPTTSPASTGTVPDSKIALIDSSAFADEKAGISRFVAAIKRVNAEFQPRQAEMQALQQQIEKANADLAKAAPLQDQKVSQQQSEKIDQMKKDFTRKGEDGQAALDKRLAEILNPIYEDIGKSLDAYAKARGITLVLDVQKTQGILSFAEGLDITKAFITEYNSKNPATAALTKP